MDEAVAEAVAAEAAVAEAVLAGAALAEAAHPGAHPEAHLAIRPSHLAPLVHLQVFQGHLHHPVHLGDDLHLDHLHHPVHHGEDLHLDHHHQGLLLLAWEVGHQDQAQHLLEENHLVRGWASVEADLRLQANPVTQNRHGVQPAVVHQLEDPHFQHQNLHQQILVVLVQVQDP